VAKACLIVSSSSGSVDDSREHAGHLTSVVYTASGKTQLTHWQWSLHQLWRCANISLLWCTVYCHWGLCWTVNTCLSFVYIQN